MKNLKLKNLRLDLSHLKPIDTGEERVERGIGVRVYVCVRVRVSGLAGGVRLKNTTGHEWT